MASLLRSAPGALVRIEPGRLLSPGPFVGIVLASIHLCVFSYPLRELFGLFRKGPGKAFSGDLAVFVSGMLSLLLAWVFAAGLAARETLVVIGGGESLPVRPGSGWGRVLSAAADAAGTPLAVCAPLFTALLFCSRGGLVSFLVFLGAFPLYIYAGALFAVGIALLWRPAGYTPATASRMRVLEALSAVAFAFSLYGIGLWSLIRGAGPASFLQSKVWTLLRVSRFLCQPLAGLLRWRLCSDSCGLAGILAAAAWITAALIVVRFGLKGAERVFLGRVRPPYGNGRGCGPAAMILESAVLVLLVRLALDLKPSGPHEGGAVLSLVTALSYGFIAGRATLSASPVPHAPLFSPRVVARWLFPSAVVLASGCIGGACSFVSTVIGYACLLVFCACVSAVARFASGDNSRVRDADPGGTVCGKIGVTFNMGHLLVCETILLFLVLSAFPGLRSDCLPHGAWAALLALTLTGCLFFGCFLPLWLLSFDGAGGGGRFRPLT